jgi:glutathione peroxidase
MRYYFSLLLALLSLACGSGLRKTKPDSVETAKNMKSIYDFKIKSIDGTLIDFAQFKGKKLLLVNVASQCGYTPQYADLQELHEKHGNKISIIGFPANNFGSQEPGSNDEIASFCKKNYGVTFQMREKISVKGDDQHALYRWLSTKELNGWNSEAPSWNFCKYLINEKGELVKFFGSKINPLDQEIIAAISN